MRTVTVSEKGQITIPAAVRRKIGISSGDELAVEVRDGEVVLSRVRTISEVAGIFREYAEGRTADWETMRRETEEAVARQVADE